MNTISQPPTNTPDIPAGEEPNAAFGAATRRLRGAGAPSRHQTGKKTPAAQKAAPGARRGGRAKTTAAARSGTKMG